MMRDAKDIFWIGSDPQCQLAIVARPRGFDWLEDELHRLHTHGIDVLVSLLERAEAEELGLILEGSLAQQAGIDFLSYPVADRSLPADRNDFREFVAGLAQHVRTGAGVGIHCRASIGRATILAACVLIHLGWAPAAALEAIGAARGCPVPDTEQQWNWILDWKREP